MEAARVLNLEVGSRLSINNKDLVVSGILQPTGSQDDQLAFTGIGTAQLIFDKQGQVSMAEVAALCKDCPIEAMVKQISDAIPGAKVMAIQQVVKSRMETLAQLKKFSYGISGIILLIGSLVVLVTMMGSVRERTDEIGIFRAIGFPQAPCYADYFYRGWDCIRPGRHYRLFSGLRRHQGCACSL